MQAIRDTEWLAAEAVKLLMVQLLADGMSPDRAALVIIRHAQVRADEENDRQRRSKAEGKAADDTDDWCDLTEGRTPIGVPYSQGG